MSDDFFREFDALLEGAKALAYVTGGMPYDDKSYSGSYLKRHALQADKEQCQRKITQAENAYDAVMAELDNNVRRVIAKTAGITTCIEDHSKESLHNHGGRLPCLAEKNGRDILKNIHSELELQQIHVPKQMTVRHKLIFEQFFIPLPETVRRELQQEVDRLKEHGIRPPLGTLTQNVLASPQAQAQLEQAYQLEVVQETRGYGEGYQTIWALRTKSPLDCETDRSNMDQSVMESPVPDEAVIPAEKRTKLTAT